MSQYVRDAWGVAQGFPGGQVYSIAQTPDGYLWVGAENGLIRFDGLNFVLMERRNWENSPTGPVLGLVTDASGDLWIRQQGPKLIRYRAGKFENLLHGLPQRETSLTAMSPGKDGAILLSGLLNGPLRHNAGGFQALVESGLPNLLSISLAETGDGRVWMGTRDAGLYYVSGSRRLGQVQGLPDLKINCLLASGGQELWIGTDNGVVRWNGEAVTKIGLPQRLGQVHALAMIKDHESNFWIGSSSGLFRLNAVGDSSFEESEERPAEAVNALFEDREANMWVGTAEGLERFRHTEFTTYSPTGAPFETSGALYVDPGGRTWFAPMQGGLYSLHGSQLEAVSSAELAKDVVYSIAGAKGELWVGRQRGGLTHLRDQGTSFDSETYTQTDGLAQNSVYAVHRSRDGTIWAGTLNAGVSSFRNGKFTTYNISNGLASNTVVSILESSDGTMWFGTPNGLNAFFGGRWRLYTSGDGLPPGVVNCLLQDSAGVLWIGTANGLAFFESGTIRTLIEAPSSLHEQIFGMEQDKARALWIATSNHVLRVNREKLLTLTIGDADVHEYGLADGLRGLEGVKRHRSVVTDSQGRIWVSTNRGISFTNPMRMMEHSAPALVHIEAISADGRQFGLAETVRVPAPHQRITLSYSGLSLSVPTRVRFKYKLDGFDPGWSESTATRDVSYTNLESGSYLFRVIASNSDGLWNSSEATLQFIIDPVFWQTWWFRLSGIVVAALVILLFFRLRVIRLTHQMNIRFEERLAERTRIAQELHDTLLQGFVSASMQLHVANDHLPIESPAKPLVARVLQLMGRIIDEGRNAVRGLRLPNADSTDLEQAFSGLQRELALPPGTDFRVLAEGQSRPLNPVIREEVYWIGREALVNAFRHSRARDIEVELEYAPSHLRVFVRDNGGGIDPDVILAGRDGHWGLSGMRERAERIGAKFRVLSGAAAGTEIELSVPGHIAFQFPPSHDRWSWLSNLKLRRHPEKQPKLGSEKTE